MKDQERTGLRRSIAAQLAAALVEEHIAGGFPADDLGRVVVKFADEVIGALELREAEDAKERAALEQREREAKARHEAEKADAAAVPPVKQVEPH